ncbi:hypothetical protein AGR7C_Cc100026 [Agrobacterium deltaense Zutra 3/1]|uniref:Uncharacterized protein n=1 Tax=Agrobacterium deltaense Zutra 3/1 TaxID=1183427 RepID=A0A1S7NUZ6_9HYPH|nr:hypothetical protein AGR7C_Cc100026 [Agrobacterium deltaense Zutra 3/1]
MAYYPPAAAKRQAFTEGRCVHSDGTIMADPAIDLPLIELIQQSDLHKSSNLPYELSGRLGIQKWNEFSPGGVR